jgi:uncharacterized membrane protein
MDDERELRRYDRRHDPTRVLALSDGIFAIAITLLVLEIHVPDLSGGKTLDEAIREVRPSFVAFVISFLVIAIAWAGHRDFFTLIRRTDRGLVWLNILYLFPVSVLPFGAALMARYDQEPAALKMYGFLLVLIALTRLIAWLYVSSRPHLVYEPLSGRLKTVGVLIGAVPAAIYLLAILIANGAPLASLLIYCAVPVLYFIGLFVDRSTAPPGSMEDAFT